MIQSIDLYRDDLRPEEQSPELVRNLALIGLGVVLLTIWGAVLQWQASTSASRLASLNAEQEQLQAQVTAASQQLSARVPDPAITAALVRAQFAVDGRRWLLGRLEEAGASGIVFSEVLGGLGRQRLEPLWLTHIRIAEGGKQLGLSGQTLSADAVPQYLQRLAAEPALKGREFEYFSISSPEKAGAPLAFSLATGCEALAEGCAESTTERAP